MEENRRKYQEEKTKKDLAQKKVNNFFSKWSFFVFHKLWTSVRASIAQIITFNLPLLKQ